MNTTVKTKVVSKSAPVVQASKFPPTIHTSALISTNAKKIMADVSIVVSMLKDHTAVTAILDGSLEVMDELAIG